jgi:L-fuconolactonase
MRDVVDSHVHVWERERHAQPWLDPDRMAAINQDFPVARAETELASRGVSGFVAVQCVNAMAETVDLLADLDGSHLARGVVGWVDLTADVPEQIDKLRAGPGGDRLVGVRHVTFEEDAGWLGRPDVGRGLTDLGAAGLTFDILIGHEQLPLAAAVVREHESTAFVLDHLGKVPMTSTTLVTWARGLTELAACPNVVAKVSGVVTEDDWTSWSVERLRPVLDHALATFGPDRLMFGSDWPLVELAGGYGPWLDAYLELTDDLTPDERRALDSGTATRAYRLERA